MEYFIDAIDRLVKQHPELKDNTSVAVLGGNAQLVCDRLALKAIRSAMSATSAV